MRTTEAILMQTTSCNVTLILNNLPEPRFAESVEKLVL